MVLNIEDPGTDRAVRELAELTGQPITTVVVAVVFGRPDHGPFGDALDAERVAVSSVSLVAAQMVVESRRGPGGAGVPADPRA